jgi:hypothetical protein
MLDDIRFRDFVPQKHEGGAKGGEVRIQRITITVTITITITAY